MCSIEKSTHTGFTHAYIGKKQYKTIEQILSFYYLISIVLYILHINFQNPFRSGIPVPYPLVIFLIQTNTNSGYSKRKC